MNGQPGLCEWRYDDGAGITPRAMVGDPEGRDECTTPSVRPKQVTLSHRCWRSSCVGVGPRRPRRSDRAPRRAAKTRP